MSLICIKNLLKSSIKVSQLAIQSRTCSNVSQQEKTQLSQFFKKVNKLIEESDVQRNFAVIHIYGQQHLVKEGDMIYFYKNIPASAGDKIKIEKCLLFGNENFTLIGRPLLDRNLINIEATISEKGMSHTHMGLRHIKRYHKFRRWYFQRYPITVLRFNEVKVTKNWPLS